MRIIILILFISSTFLLANSKKHSIGLGTALTSVKTNNISKENKNDILFQYGYDITDYLNLGLRSSFQTINSKELRHNYSYGVYLKPFYKLNDNINIYTSIGYGEHSLSRTKDDFINKTTIQRDISYGLGLEHKINSYTYFFTDYIQYINKTNTNIYGKYAININSLSFGLNFKFGFINDDKKIIKTKTKKIKHTKLIKEKIHIKTIKPIKKTKPILVIKQNKIKSTPPIEQPTSYIYFNKKNKVSLELINDYVKFLSMYKDMDIQLQSYSHPINPNKEKQRVLFLKELFIKKGINKNRIMILKKNHKIKYKKRGTLFIHNTLKSLQEYRLKKNFINIVYRASRK